MILSAGQSRISSDFGVVCSLGHNTTEGKVLGPRWIIAQEDTEPVPRLMRELRMRSKLYTPYHPNIELQSIMGRSLEASQLIRREPLHICIAPNILIPRLLSIATYIKIFQQNPVPPVHF